MIKPQINPLAKKNTECMSENESWKSRILSSSSLANHLTAIIVYFLSKTSFQVKSPLEMLPSLSCVIIHTWDSPLGSTFPMVTVVTA